MDDPPQAFSSYSAPAETSGHPQSQGQNTPPPPPRQRRPRAARACDLCRAKKNKCDELYPCTFCRTRNAPCVYQGQEPRRRYNDDYVRQLESELKQMFARVAEAEAQVSRAESHPSASHAPSAESPSHLGYGNPPGLQNSASLRRPHTKDGTPTVEGPPVRYSISEELESIPTPSSIASGRQGREREVSGVNHHTRDVEFYGSSSSIALLSHLQSSGQGKDDKDADVLLSSLHNAAFRPAGAPNREPGTTQPAKLRYYHQCRGFLDSFFSTIHYVHPFLDKSSFLERCERQLWSSTEQTGVFTSFTALYYSVLSLGALVGVRGDEPLEGLNNLEWSRKFFDEAKQCSNVIGMVTDLEMVQCYFIMAKVCQNEMNAHWSYMYVGLAVRTALAIGINREPGPDTTKSAAQLKEESRTWWGLYSLESEISFSMGRPDTLGADLFHNRRLPLVDGPGSDANGAISMDPNLLEPAHCAIIGIMVRFSRIIRSICQRIYLANLATPEAVAVTYQIENDLNDWAESLPVEIAPTLSTSRAIPTLKGVKAAQWAKRQRLVLNIRYHNLRLLLFGSLLLRSTVSERASIPGCIQGVRKCLDSAKETISVIYQTFEHNDFFRTWFYNTTYTVFAASIILVYANQEHLESGVAPLLQSVDMAVEILEAMDECFVALQAAKLLRRARSRAAGRFGPTGEVSPPNPELVTDGTAIHLNQYWGWPLGLLDVGEMCPDFAWQMGPMGGNDEGAMPLSDQSML